MMGILFASVFENYLIIPVSLIFGARNSPSYFSVLSELRAHLATHAKLFYDGMVTPLVAKTVVQPDPTPAEIALFVATVRDEFNPGMDGTFPQTQNSTFVDDNATATADKTHAIEGTHNSAVSCYVLFGDPDDDR